MPDRPRELLGGLSAASFLKSCWQKSPRLVRGAVPGIKPPTDAAGLMQLACRDDVESRIVIGKEGDHPWQVLHGPFNRQQFNRLPDTHWTLLVQNADLHLDAAHGLLQQFDFVPAWRVDDVMISFAVSEGGVGPHLDSYDVFLLQAEGRRHWSINRGGYDEDDFIEGLDLRIIGSYEAEEEWLLEAGDMLYLPPGVAHHGVAKDDCITCSIGFRAPSRLELLGRYLDEGGLADRRYADPGLAVPEHRGEIDAATLQAVRELMREPLADDEALHNWFGRHATQLPEIAVPARPAKPLTAEQFLMVLRRNNRAHRSRSCRSAFMRGPGSAISLFANGRSFLLPAAAERFVLDFTGSGVLQARDDIEETTLQVMCDLHNEGLIVFR